MYAITGRRGACLVDTPETTFSLSPGAVDDATRFLAQHEDTRNRFDRVAELVDGFESPFGLELLATVHWITKETATPSVNEMTVGDLDPMLVEKDYWITHCLWGLQTQEFHFELKGGTSLSKVVVLE